PAVLFLHSAPTEIYTLSLHDALPIWPRKILSPLIGERKVTPSSLILRNAPRLNTWKPPESVRIGFCHCMKSCRSPCFCITPVPGDRKSTRLNSSHVKSSYAVFCLKKK